jgi:hypothetical protein
VTRDSVDDRNAVPASPPADPTRPRRLDRRVERVLSVAWPLSCRASFGDPIDALAVQLLGDKIEVELLLKWQERVDVFVKGALFGAGKMTSEEIAKQLAHASWVQSVFSALQAVFEAIKGLFF